MKGWSSSPNGVACKQIRVRKLKEVDSSVNGKIASSARKAQDYKYGKLT